MEHSQKQIVTSGDMSDDIVSQIIGLNEYFGYAVQAKFTTSGTLGGVLALQASVNHKQDLQGNVLVAGDWDTIEDSPITLTAAGTFTWNLRDTNYSYFRLIYTAAGSDSGVLNAFCTIKGM